METVTSKGADEGKRLACRRQRHSCRNMEVTLLKKLFFPFAEPRLWERIDHRTKRRREDSCLAKSKGMCCALADHFVPSKGASEETRPLMAL